MCTREVENILDKAKMQRAETSGGKLVPDSDPQLCRFRETAQRLCQALDREDNYQGAAANLIGEQASASRQHYADRMLEWKVALLAGRRHRLREGWAQCGGRVQKKAQFTVSRGEVD